MPRTKIPRSGLDVNNYLAARWSGGQSATLLNLFEMSPIGQASACNLELQVGGLGGLFATTSCTATGVAVPESRR
jgi:hypothetical protein